MKGQDKVKALSGYARKAALLSAEKSRLSVHVFEKDEQGVPVSFNGIFWSVAHKENVVAGVVSTQRIGIDVEKIKPVSDAVFKKILTPDENMQFKSQDRKLNFFRAFTAKEAVLKKTTVGIKGLSKTKIESVLDDTYLIIRFQNEKYCIENFYFEDYLAAVTKDQCDVNWVLG
ncbi:MAG: 4'-phosphopantetheinyl transferase superfamily protein [Proteobacteria bacterium]|nr:4'-phosphopantetheinyl transferase superfamily protein [Pseudomonadota bacterium]MBU1388594.1 4'-phosphopantetheinyl transferase superfamily protein [Pseudomonadota bacterium]MBU1541750.1 4'-phosphopantetheinyl transferase superfamily protein [Pseudomonadota bacterium]MBU2430951.1 4'-phosphopantetheinyl transferase superfamily protein [Pseudomonadota bacterium]MBU2482350.1 4'-phosphopantetheinyl transferase superfamily protein [Pseudomonadota bacterium]